MPGNVDNFGEVARTEASRFLHACLKVQPQDDLNWELGAAKKKTVEHVEQSNKQGMAGLRAQLAKEKAAKK